MNAEDRRKAVELLKESMLGREELRAIDAAGREVRAFHDAGFIGCKYGSDFGYLELMPDSVIEALIGSARVAVEKDRAAILEHGADVVDVKAVTGIALGSSERGDKPGFKDARCLGECRPGEGAEGCIERLAGGGKPPTNPYLPGQIPTPPGKVKTPPAHPKEWYLDPEHNPMIPGGPAAKRQAEAEKKAEDPKTKYFDPARNPFIKV